MRRLFVFCLFILMACAPSPQLDAAQPSHGTPIDEPQSNVDILANLPAANCSGGLTPQDQEGPYFKEGSPENANLFTAGIQGKKLILAGMVVNQDCLPIPHVRMEFWQADSNGEYDNKGYTLRGHQSTDNKGRYYLETVFPGIYASRPVRHIHVKVESLGGMTLTTQLYFPEQPVAGLTVHLEDRGDFYLAIFNFVVQS